MPRVVWRRGLRTPRPRRGRLLRGSRLRRFPVPSGTEQTRGESFLIQTQRFDCVQYSMMELCAVFLLFFFFNLDGDLSCVL